MKTLEKMPEKKEGGAHPPAAPSLPPPALGQKKPFSLTAGQMRAQKVLAGSARHSMLFGGSRSGKTFLLVRAIIIRALKAPNSRHVIFRYRFNAVKSAIWLDTFPKVLMLCFPDVIPRLNKTDFYATFPNGSEIWFSGLDDKDRAEKVLGMEFATIYLNECSQIPWASRNIAITRLAQYVETVLGGGDILVPRAFYDCNPPSKAHWAYSLFVGKRDPESKRELSDIDDYVSYKLNPVDNIDNIASGYLDTLGSLSPRLRARFLDGDWADATPGALFDMETIETWRVVDGVVPDMVRIVVSVDPSGSGDSENADNDAIGICVVGLGTDGNAYLLEDCTCKAGPSVWGNVATTAFDRHGADIIVGEVNYGGAMVKHVIQSQRSRTPFKAVTASRGKHIRAEPFSVLYSQGKVRHVGRFNDLEDELISFSTMGYMGVGSPNRADSLIWGLVELFPSMTNRSEDDIKGSLRAPPLPKNLWKGRHGGRR